MFATVLRVTRRDHLRRLRPRRMGCQSDVPLQRRRSAPRGLPPGQISPASLAPPSPVADRGGRPERYEIAVSRRVSVLEAQFHGAEPACLNGNKLRKYGQNGTPVTALVRYHSRHADTPLTHVTLEHPPAGSKHPQSRDLATKTVQIGRQDGQSAAQSFPWSSSMVADGSLGCCRVSRRHLASVMAAGGQCSPGCCQSVAEGVAK
jgi:hypothetical protein